MQRRHLLSLGLVSLLLACRGNGDETEIFFDNSTLHTIEIEVSAADFGQLVPGNSQRIPCTFTFDGKKKEEVGIRLKGGFGSLQDINGKPGFSVKTNEFVKGLDIFGVKRFTLDNSVQDPSFLSANVGHEIFRQAGIPTSRTAYAKVSLNGEYYGVYVIVESYNGDFLDRNFQDSTGNLYEGPGDVLAVDSLDLDSNQEINDRSDLAALRDVLVNASNEQLLGAVSELVDIDLFLTYWAVEALTYHWDGYATTGATLPFPLQCCSPNNYNLYHEPTLDKFFFMPHGIDNLFLDVGVDVLAAPSRNSSLPSRLFALPEIRQRFADKLREVLDTAWDIDALQERIDDSIKLIRRAVEEGDRNPNFSLGAFESSVNDKIFYINDRPQIVLDQLSAAGL